MDFFLFERRAVDAVQSGAGSRRLRRGPSHQEQSRWNIAGSEKDTNQVGPPERKHDPHLLTD